MFGSPGCMSNNRIENYTFVILITYAHNYTLEKSDEKGTESKVENYKNVQYSND